MLPVMVPVKVKPKQHKEMETQGSFVKCNILSTL